MRNLPIVKRKTNCFFSTLPDAFPPPDKARPRRAMRLSRRKKIVVIAAAVAAVAVFAAAAVSEYGPVSAEARQAAADYADRQSSGDETGWTAVEPAAGGTVTLENDRCVLTLFTDTTRCTVTDKRSGPVYQSY